MPSAIKRIEREALLAMSDQQIVAEVASILKKVVPEEPGEIQLDSRLVEDIGIDSLGTYELVMDAEDRFGIQITDDQLVNVKTVKDVVDFIKSQLE
jgi:acyl carrier protein